MLKSSGSNHINAVSIFSVSISSANLTGTPALSVSARANLMNSETGFVYGTTGTSSTWSDDTKKLLNDLLQSMEKDIAAVVFVKQESTNSAPEEEEPPLDEVPGL